MVRKPAEQFQFDASVLSQLACPACFGDLRLDKARLACTRCPRSYPIVDGIPVLIAASEDTAKARDPEP